MSKTGFRAFAAGMIVATSVLGGTYLISDNKSASADEENKKVTQKDIESYLTSNGKIALTTGEYEELLAAKDKAVQQPAENNTQQKESTPTETSEEPKKEVIKYNLVVRSGMTTSEISDLLEQNGIIDDSFNFDQFLIKGKYHQRIQLGTFAVQRGMTFQQLADALTR
ncbi:hypothetical protein WQ54_30920 [Bacillus sp. SA1-12]|uniref:endolytic transglycosylase MltG n=1 Tax=Bacillus sp. SA1-12 TaxID=1455638 RepID=UPI0006274020|nr:endolytic transglycosylase MltG [Bacillus sp. SA1-12]KKI88608.1 hypothetical protein WQ54_30920 [Bacillus sp. SA1-12]